MIMNKGKLKELNDSFGYGYIQCQKTGNLIFHKFEDLEYELPEVGDLVSFDLVEGNNSELAINIKLIGKRQQKKMLA